MESLITTQFSTNGDISRRLRLYTIIFLSLIFNAILLILINNIFVALSTNESHLENSPFTVNIISDVKNQIKKIDEQRVEAIPNLPINSLKIIQPHLILIPNFNQVFELDETQENFHSTFPQSYNNYETNISSKEIGLSEFESNRNNSEPVILGVVSLLSYTQCFEIHERDPLDDLSIDTWAFTRC
jgi:hypothetical protein